MLKDSSSINYFLVFFGVLIITISCSSNQRTNQNSVDLYDSTFNPVRKKIGLNTIKKNFFLGDIRRQDSTETIYWLSDKRFFDNNKKLIQDRIIIPVYIAKTITICNKQIICETDIYMSSELCKVYNLKGEQSNINVSLKYKYYFCDTKSHEKGWSYFKGFETISKEQADSILQSWNISR